MSLSLKFAIACSMPPKKSKSKVAGAKASAKTQPKVCDLCYDQLEESHEVLVCEGGCNSSVHRYCAGVTHYHYEKLTTGAEPFVCMFCSLKTHRALVSQLQLEVENLKAELASTKTALQERTANLVTASTEPGKIPLTSLSWNVVAGRRAKRPPRKRTAAVDESTSKPDAAAMQSSRTHRQRSRVVIPGARRIWGTMRTTTCTAVTNALKQLTTVDVTRLTVKRKFKAVANDPTRVHKWWFIVRGEEDLLQQVEGAWNTVAVQTAWKLEPAYMYEDKDTTQQWRNSEGCIDTALQQIVSNSESTAVNNTDESTAINNNDESTAANVSESTPANDSFPSRNVTLSFLDTINQ